MTRYALFVLLGLFRVLWSRCPSCNLDAPAIDTCVTCRNYRGQFPAAFETRHSWFMRYLGSYRVSWRVFFRGGGQ